VPDSKNIHIDLLKHQAKRLREIATQHKTDVSPDLVKMARKIEARVAKLERDDS
jgi:hypothetical protein